MIIARQKKLKDISFIFLNFLYFLLFFFDDFDPLPMCILTIDRTSDSISRDLDFLTENDDDIYNVNVQKYNRKYVCACMRPRLCIHPYVHLVMISTTVSRERERER